MTTLHLIPDGHEIDPLTARVDRDGMKAVVSWMVAEGLEGKRAWGPISRAANDLPLTDPEAILLQKIVYTHDSAHVVPALIEYVRYLQGSEGLAGCALLFAELARSLSPNPAPELLIELGALYRMQCRFVEAGDVWHELARMGIERNNLWLQVRAQIGLGRMHRHLGNLPKARELFTRAEADAYTFPDLRAMAFNNLGDVLAHQQPPDWIEAALKFYGAAYLYTDVTLKNSALVNLAICAVGCHYYKLADVTLRRVIGAPGAPGSPCWADVTNAMIERLDVCSALGDWEGVKHVRTLLRWRLERFTPDMKCDYHYRLGLIELRRGKNPTNEWNQAHWFASQHKLGEWMIRLEKLLETKPEPVEPVEVPQLFEVWEDLEKQATTAGV
jgi:hypothetical protein